MHACGSGLRVWLAVSALMVAAAVPPLGAQGPGTPAVEGRITRLHPRFDELVPPAARLEEVVRGHDWLEGPLWDRLAGCLLFSDIPRNAVYRWCEGRGESVILQPSGYSGKLPFKGNEPGSNGLAFDANGRLVLAEHGDRRISRIEPDGRKVTVAARFMGQRLNSPNDVTPAPDGGLFFTDPPWGLPGWWDDPGKELAWSGVYHVAPSGEVRLLTREFQAPNGIALSADGRTLAVSESKPELGGWHAFELQPDGSLGARQLLLDARPWMKGRKGAPDGLKFDHQGHLFAGGPGGVYVLAPDGTLLGVVETGSPASNTAWGEDGTVLYITSGTRIFRLRTGTRGAGW